VPKIALIDPLQDPRWDRFVENHPFGWICHLSGWKQVLETTFNHMQGYYFALLDDAGERIEAGLPVFHVRSRILGDRLVSIPFATLSDPLISTAEQFADLFSAVNDLSATLKAGFIEIRTLHAASLLRDGRLGKTDLYKNHCLDVNEPPERLKGRFRRLCVRNINRAQAGGVKVREADSDSGIEAFYGLHRLHRKKSGLPLHPLRFFRRLWQVFSPAKRIALLVAEKEKVFLGGLLLLKHGDRISCDYLSTREEYRRLSPASLLYWEGIQMACREGFAVFDFGRTHDRNRNLMEFKARWGTRVEDLSQYYYPHGAAGAVGRQERSAKQRLLQMICRHAPNFAQKAIGEFCYRHMG
jgi:CelD/BcsL family acetyltransferase involved in cellulose biosynthesis